MTNKKGFTLIELLVVIAIIGILSAIGLVSLNGAREKARDSKAKSDLATVRTAMALYYDDNTNAYPGNVAQGTDDWSRSSTGALAGLCTATATTSTCTLNSIWDPVKKTIVPTYVADLKSPSANKYGYKASNFTGTAGGTVGGFVLYYQLEGAGKYFYSVDESGNVKDAADQKASIVSPCTTLDSTTTLKDGKCPQ